MEGPQPVACFGQLMSLTLFFGVLGCRGRFVFVVCLECLIFR